MCMQMRTTAMQRDAKICVLLPSAQITMLEKTTNTIIYNMSDRVESDILHTDLAITCMKKQFGLSSKNTKLWPLIVFTSKQTKFDAKYISNTLQSRSVYCAAISDISLVPVNTRSITINEDYLKSNKLWPLIIHKSKQIHFIFGVYMSCGYQIIIGATKNSY